VTRIARSRAAVDVPTHDADRGRQRRAFVSRVLDHAEGLVLSNRELTTGGEKEEQKLGQSDQPSRESGVRSSSERHATAV
jgi:hypothetical protein